MTVKNLTDAQEAASIALAELEQARELYEQFVECWQNVMREAKRLDLHVALQADAYMPFVRDQGLGLDPESWFDIAEAQLQDVTDTEEE